MVPLVHEWRKVFGTVFGTMVSRESAIAVFATTIVTSGSVSIMFVVMVAECSVCYHCNLVFGAMVT